MISIRSPQQLGDALRAARKRIGLTQPQLALAAGVGVRFIVDLEAGKPTLRLENILRVVDALGGELQLIGLVDQMPLSYLLRYRYKQSPLTIVLHALFSADLFKSNTCLSSFVRCTLHSGISESND